MTAPQRWVVLGITVLAVAGTILALEMRRVGGGLRLSADDITASQVSLPEASAERAETVEDKAATYAVAREISSPDGFINVDDITISELIGKQVILLDIWTYSCINCQRTLPYINSWHEKYGDQGLTIIGLHTPEFEFEKDIDNVRAAVEKWGIKYPVVLDNDYSTWRAYQNRYWPRKYLIDIDGFIVYDHIGEGGYDETEQKIVELLNERSQVLGEQAVSLDSSKPIGIDQVDYRRVESPEMYLGYSRVEHQGNLNSPDCDNRECDYASDRSPDLNWYDLIGKWRMEDERAVLTGAEAGSIILEFSASKVNLVAGTENVDFVQAEILLDGQPVDALRAGSDVSGSQVRFGDHDLYNLIDLRGEYGRHTLEIRFEEAGVSGFAFTFG